MDKQLYGQTFISKRQFLKWFENHQNEIDWDEEVTLEFYYKKEEEKDDDFNN